MVEWLRLAGFELIVKNHAGDQFGWSQLGGKMAGHLDGILLNGFRSTPYRRPFPGPADDHHTDTRVRPQETLA